jgi:hypothetical protein
MKWTKMLAQTHGCCHSDTAEDLREITDIHVVLGSNIVNKLSKVILDSMDTKSILLRPLLPITNMNVSRHILVSRYIILEASNGGRREYLTRKNANLNGAHLPYRVHEATACYSASQEYPELIANLP